MTSELVTGSDTVLPMTTVVVIINWVLVTSYIVLEVITGIGEVGIARVKTSLNQHIVVKHYGFTLTWYW